METTRLYWTNPTRREFEAEVIDRNESSVVLDRTAFYPTGGGQPHDTGTLEAGGEQWTVPAVSGQSRITHDVDGSPPTRGTTVRGTIDWDRRYAHMRYHTAQHLLSAVCLEEFDAPTVGNQLYTDRARLDCERDDRFSPADLGRIEEAVNEHIEADRSVKWYQLDRETAEAELDASRTRLDLLPDHVDPIRIVDIEGVDRTACAGTHVARTGAIGTLRVTGRETAGAGRERVRFTLSAG